MVFEKIKKMFKENDEKKKTENLIAFLIILVVTLILVNKILNDDSYDNKGTYQNQVGVELVNNNNDDSNSTLIDNEEDDFLEKRIEETLSKINGIGNVNVLITYQKENPMKIEGAIVIAEGAENIEIKKNIISAVEAVTRPIKS